MDVRTRRCIYLKTGRVLSKFLTLTLEKNALAKWVGAIQFMIGKHQSNKCAKYLLNWPIELTGIIRLKISGKPISYLVTKDDDLGTLVRVNLKGWEDESRNFFELLSCESQVVLDIGAYTGIYSLIALLSNSSSKVIAFEPNPKVAQVLRHNISINGFLERCEIYEKAVSDRSSIEFLYRDRLQTGTSMHTLRPGGTLIGEVESLTLDDLLPTLKVDLIKMDIEGWEHTALAGARKMIKRSKPNILVEALDPDARERLVRYFSDFRYDNPIVLDQRNLLFLR